jgi:hypothetical protein
MVSIQRFVASVLNQRNTLKQNRLERKQLNKFWIEERVTRLALLGLRASVFKGV